VPKVTDQYPSLRQRDHEPDRTYRAMLLWCMAGHDYRSIRPMLGMGAATVDAVQIKRWASKWKWAARTRVVPSVDVVATIAYSEHVATIPKRRDRLRAIRLLARYQDRWTSDAVGNMALELPSVEQPPPRLEAVPPTAEDEPRAPQDGPVGEDWDEDAPGGPGGPTAPHGPIPAPPPEWSERAPDIAEMASVAHPLAKHNTPEKIDTLVGAVDVGIRSVLVGLQKGEIKPRLADLPRLIRARALLTGQPTQHLAVAIADAHGAKASLVQAESVRMRQARSMRDEAAYLDAALVEAEEHLAILRALRGAVPTVRRIDVIEAESEEVA